MKLFIRGRRSGKTTVLIAELLKDPNAVLLVHSAAEAERLKDVWPDLQEQIVWWGHAEKLRGQMVTAVHVDNLDLILPLVLKLGPHRIGIVTVTGETI